MFKVSNIQAPLRWFMLRGKIYSRWLTDNGTKVEDVYLDCLVSVIDNLVEKTSNYKQSVEEEYGVK